MDTFTIEHLRLTHICVIENLNHLETSLYMCCKRNISWRCSCNSEADASELQDNLEEMFPGYIIVHRSRIIDHIMIIYWDDIIFFQSMKVGKSPLFLMLPVAVTCSFAYVLPVSTPPNAMVYATGKLTISDLVSQYYIRFISFKAYQQYT